MAYVCHLMACGFVIVGRDGESRGIPSWFEADSEGPFVAEDTTGANGDRQVYSIYIAAFYFALTSMTSIGYGDITPKNNSERVYVVCLEFVAAIVFATTIASITAVVTTLDTNARNTREQLDAVNSFVTVRQFPEMMARKINRHFRHFYSKKSAIDEAKIFSELSATLRKEVSGFLIEDLMGKESFFMTMPPTLWPRLLPLLKPMGFEADEVICLQDEDCAEMYVVVSGMFIGQCRVHGEPAPRKRHVGVGGSVNALHAVNIWHKCLETVFAKEVTESYALNSRDMDTLFATDSDMAAYSTMQSRVVKHFKMDAQAEGAPTAFGKPLYYSCFSTVEVSVAEVTGAFRHMPVRKGKNVDADRPTGSEVFLIIDLVDKASCKPFNANWRYSTAKGFPVPTTELECEDQDAIETTAVDVDIDAAARAAFKSKCEEVGRSDLTKKQFKEVVKTLLEGSDCPPDKDLNAVFVLADEDKGGTVDEDEFVELFKKIKARDDDSAARVAFKSKCEEVGRSDLTKKQFKEVVKALMKGSDCPPDKDLNAAFVLADEDKGGTVDEDEFVELFRKVKAGEVRGLGGWGSFSFFGPVSYLVERLFVGETVRWHDVHVPFGQAAVRVRVFLQHNGRPILSECVGKVCLRSGRVSKPHLCCHFPVIPTILPFRLCFHLLSVAMKALPSRKSPHRMQATHGLCWRRSLVR